MRKSFVTIGLILLLVAAGQAQDRQEPPQRSSARTSLMLEVAIRGYVSGGKASSMAGDSGAEKLESYVWADQTLCAMGSGKGAPGNTPWVGWHFTGTVTSSTMTQMVVNVEWQRLWENGRRTDNGPKGSRQLTLRSGERVELDRVASTKSGPCGTVEAKLEAAVSTRPAYLLSYFGTQTGTTVGRGRGGATGTTTGRATGEYALRGGRGGATGGSTYTINPWARGLLVTLGSHDAEIWLVHKKPDGSEVVQQQTVRFSGAARDFSFPPVQIAGRGGDLTVDISGKLQLTNTTPTYRYFSRSGQAITAMGLALQGSAGRGSGGSGAGRGGGSTVGRGGAAGRESTVSTDPTSPSPMIIVSISRRARRASPFVDTRGTTDMSLQIPQSSDVLSFELPPLQKATEDLLSGHVFSIRLRVTPVK